MLRANFFLKFFKYKQSRSYKIVPYNSNNNFSLQDKIITDIVEIDQKISENSKALVEAQIVKFRSAFSRPNNFIDQFGKYRYKAKLEESINWHQKQLKALYLSRRELEIKVEKLKGIFWLNRIKRLVKIILIGFLIFLCLFIFLSGFMIIIYLMPFIIFIFLVYFIFTRRY